MAIVSAIIGAFLGTLAIEKIKERNIISHIKSRIKNTDDLLERGIIIDALSEYKSMLSTVSYKNYPQEYAHIKEKEGTCYSDIAETCDKENNLQRAIQAYEETLKIRTVEKYPIDYGYL